MITLQDGKTYRNRLGGVVKVRLRPGHEYYNYEYPFEAVQLWGDVGGVRLDRYDAYFARTGQWLLDDDFHNEDLIEEVQEPLESYDRHVRTLAILDRLLLAYEACASCDPGYGNAANLLAEAIEEIKQL